MPVWHASLSARTDFEMLPWSRFRLKARAYARDQLFTLLWGVGEGDTRRERSAYVLHARRKLSARELALLDPAWCAIPPIDIAGGPEDGLVPW